MICVLADCVLVFLDSSLGGRSGADGSAVERGLGFWSGSEGGREWEFLVFSSHVSVCGNIISVGDGQRV